MYDYARRRLCHADNFLIVIGHMKAEGHLGRCHLKRTAGDAVNAILTAVGHNLRLVLAWLRILLRLILAALSRALATHLALKSVC
jgi:IS5 family transposase